MKDIHAVLRDTWGHADFRPLQERVIRSVLEGRDTLALLPTGGGKSLCFQVPALAMERMCLVVSPLIALMKDQVERLREKGILAVSITSGMSRTEVDHALESCAAGKRAFLYVSPERLQTDLFRARLAHLPIGLIAVDEAHCISQWGYDFRPSYLRITTLRETFPQVPIVALTATATPEVAGDIMEKLAFRAPNLLRGDFARPELTWWVTHGEDRSGRLLRLAQRTTGTAIVYVRERKSTVRVADLLRHHGFTAAPYHAGLDHAERDRVQKAWSSDAVRFVVATTAFGMGIDKADVRLVVHWTPPQDIESYYQEAGRAGRDRLPALAVLLNAPGDAERLLEKAEASFPPLADVRRVYQAFADLHRIALGSGAHEAYRLDLQELARRTDLPVVQVANAMKALELDGLVALSEGVHDPSRAIITAPHRTVYDIRVRDQRLGPLVEVLLRMHGGLFEEPVRIDEERAAQHLKWSVDRVRKALHELHRMGVLHYRERTDDPLVTLLCPRLDATRILLSPEALADRLSRARTRARTMCDYLNLGAGCRERHLRTYFGDADGADCGRCDLCRARATATAPDGSMVSEPLAARWAADAPPGEGSS
ncbi:MAG: RecQ family ATP-dependent DNA helicase [Flavobacteriales bacterium]|nr:RecQ family ATP-dependent DNA helicase [Flavobacteriales bacterium]